MKESVRAESLNHIARTMLTKGIDPTLIAEVTGLTVTEIKALHTE